MKYSDSDASIPIVSPKSLVPTHFNSPKIYQRVPVNINEAWIQYWKTDGHRSLDLWLQGLSWLIIPLDVYHHFSHGKKGELRNFPLQIRSHRCAAAVQLRWSTTGKVSSMRNPSSSASPRMCSSTGPPLCRSPPRSSRKKTTWKSWCGPAARGMLMGC